VYAATYDFRGEVGLRRVAFKRLLEGLASDPAAGLALARELGAQAAVAAHPNVTRILGACADAVKGVGLMLEFATFGSLFSYLEGEAPIAWTERLQIAADVACGLAALHGTAPRPVVHNDLKSANVLLFDAGDGRKVAKLSDFGLADFHRNSLSSRRSSKTGVGTVNWKAPEVSESHYTPKPTADIWSLGMVIYELLCRRIPYAELDDELKILRKVAFDVDKLPDLDKAEAGAPEALVGLMRGCCATKPEDRPTAEDVSRWLQDIRGAEQAGTPRSDKHHRELVEMLGALAETIVGAIDGAAERTEIAVQKHHRG
jgi:hypothetical protein